MSFTASAGGARQGASTDSVTENKPPVPTLRARETSEGYGIGQGEKVG